LDLGSILHLYDGNEDPDALRIGMGFLVDLNAVVNRYIGDTEKNLKRIFGAGGSDDAGLFLDEADALFGKRTDVKDSHDRYDN
jgi:ATP-dependent 26S proteasome regulatory subunit